VSIVEFSLNHVLNASKELEDTVHYPGIRMFTAAHAVADSPQAEVGDKTGGTGVYANASWAVSAPAAFSPVHGVGFSWFSAVCYLFGRELYRELEGAVPIGLVASDWGGQAIEVFSSPEALGDKTCGGTAPSEHHAPPPLPPSPDGGNDDAWDVDIKSQRSSDDSWGGVGDACSDTTCVEGRAPTVSSSQLWYAMLAPFLPMRFTGVVWVSQKRLPLSTCSHALLASPRLASLKAL